MSQDSSARPPKMIRWLSDSTGTILMRSWRGSAKKKKYIRLVRVKNSHVKFTVVSWWPCLKYVKKPESATCGWWVCVYDRKKLAFRRVWGSLKVLIEWDGDWIARRKTNPGLSGSHIVFQARFPSEGHDSTALKTVRVSIFCSYFVIIMFRLLNL